VRCANCEQPLREGVTSCPWCGGELAPPIPPAPPEVADEPPVPPVVPVGVPRPTSGGWRLPALVIGLVLVLTAIGLGFVVASRHSNTASAGGAGPALANGAASSTGQPDAPTNPELGDTGSVTTDPSQLLDSGSAKTALDGEVARDQNSAEQLVGHWVPQLSSKRPGLVADGITYDYPQIWANFVQLRAQHPGVLLIWSGNYVSYKLADFYVVVVPDSYPDGASANEWCDSNGFAPDDCYAKFLSHSGGSGGTSLLRG
jgi:hypothetical protein